MNRISGLPTLAAVAVVVGAFALSACAEQGQGEPEKMESPAAAAPAPAVTPFPGAADICTSDFDEESRESTSRCAKKLLGKYGSYIRYNPRPRSVHREPEGGEWKYSDNYFSVHAKNGVVKKYAYSDEEGETFRPVPLLVYEPLNLLLVEIGYYESQGYELVSLNTGHVTELQVCDADSPVFSEDGQRFLSFGASMETAECSSRVAVYRLQKGVPVLELELIGDPDYDDPDFAKKNWVPFDVKWVGTGFEFIKGTHENTKYDEGDGKYRSSGPLQTYKLRDGKWRLQSSSAKGSTKEPVLAGGFRNVVEAAKFVEGYRPEDNAGYKPTVDMDGGTLYYGVSSVLFLPPTSTHIVVTSNSSNHGGESLEIKKLVGDKLIDFGRQALPYFNDRSYQLNQTGSRFTLDSVLTGQRFIYKDGRFAPEDDDPVIATDRRVFLYDVSCRLDGNSKPVCSFSVRNPDNLNGDRQKITLMNEAALFSGLAGAGWQQWQQDARSTGCAYGTYGGAVFGPTGGRSGEMRLYKLLDSGIMLKEPQIPCGSASGADVVSSLVVSPPAIDQSERAGSSAEPAEASFDCNQASTRTERLICSDAVLARSDKELAGMYWTILKNASSPGFNVSAYKGEQRAWLMTVRDACPDAKCLRQAYEERRSGLIGSYGTGG